MTPLPEFPVGSALDFLRRVWRLNHALERLSSRMEKRLGVTAQQRLVIRCIGSHPGIGAGQLAAMLHVDPGTVSATLRRLEQKELVVRRKHPADTRRISLGLTRKGRRLDGPQTGTAEEAVEELLASSPAREASAALKLLERLAARLDEKGVR